MANEKTNESFQVYNVATGDYITVTEIAHLAVECCGIQPGQTELDYTGGKRGWKGDVPIVRLNTDRMRRLGWTCKRTSRKALKESIESMIMDIKEGRMGG
jgi:UDP-glucose 4-epimerase